MAADLRRPRETAGEAEGMAAEGMATEGMATESDGMTMDEPAGWPSEDNGENH
jgi:hypothetical protein